MRASRPESCVRRPPFPVLLALIALIALLALLAAVPAHAAPTLMLRPAPP
jgi:hypothetical protein